MITFFLPGITDTEWMVIKYTVVLSIMGQLAWFGWWQRTSELKTERQRAYVLSLLSSIIMTLGSLPYVYQVTYHQRGNLNLLLTSTSTSAFIASPVLTLMPVALTAFFMSFLILDLAVGLIWYKSKIVLLKGYAHHIVYFCLLAWVLNRHYGGIFMGMCVLEIPTLLLSAGSVHGPWRRDYLFALTFLATRIVFHGYMVACAYSLYGLTPITRALAAFLPVHLYWFFGFIQQQKRLYQLNQEMSLRPCPRSHVSTAKPSNISSSNGDNKPSTTTTTITTNSAKGGVMTHSETTISTPATIVTMRNVYGEHEQNVHDNKKPTTTMRKQHAELPGSFIVDQQPDPSTSVPSSGPRKIRGFWDRAYQRLRQEQHEQEKHEQEQRRQRHTLAVPAH